MIFCPFRNVPPRYPFPSPPPYPTSPPPPRRSHHCPLGPCSPAPTTSDDTPGVFPPSLSRACLIPSLRWFPSGSSRVVLRSTATLSTNLLTDWLTGCPTDCLDYCLHWLTTLGSLPWSTRAAGNTCKWGGGVMVGNCDPPPRWSWGFSPSPSVCTPLFFSLSSYNRPCLDTLPTNIR